MDTDQPLQDQALDYVRELLATHWREAKGSADDDGKFAIGLRISVQNSAPGVILFEATRGTRYCAPANLSRWQW